MSDLVEIRFKKTRRKFRKAGLRFLEKYLLVLKWQRFSSILQNENLKNSRFFGNSWFSKIHKKLIRPLNQKRLNPGLHYGLKSRSRQKPYLNHVWCDSNLPKTKKASKLLKRRIMASVLLISRVIIGQIEIGFQIWIAQVMLIPLRYYF